MIVAILGPDGSGKSSVIEQVRLRAASQYRDVRYFHLRPRLLLPQKGEGRSVTAPHAHSPYGSLLSTLKLLYFLFDYSCGYLFVLRPLAQADTLVIFDRYYHDLIVDPLRYRYGGSYAFARLIGRLVPKPDLWIILDANATVLQARKQEVPFAESERQREAYAQLAKHLAHAVVLNATQPLDDVVTLAMEAIAARRNGLTPRHH